ncbi:MAG TPA: hypothetical protein VK593_00605 [Edaphobacter sp.]|nr:hypothetical protein [Edaphobacter sp.]
MDRLSIGFGRALVDMEHPQRDQVIDGMAQLFDRLSPIHTGTPPSRANQRLDGDKMRNDHIANI